MRKIQVGDTVKVTYQESVLVGEVIETRYDEVMITGHIHWFKNWECKILKFGPFY